jgi:thiamine biosynthesis lipoprotein
MNRYLVAIPFFLCLISCSDKEEHLHSLTGNAFGTTYNIQYYGKEGRSIEKGIDSVIYSINRSVSTYMPESDISRINDGDTTVIVDAIFKEVFRISEIVYTHSNGYFDPTIGVLRNAYGFGDEKPLPNMDSIVLDSLRKYVGFRKVQLQGNGTISKLYPEIYFDFNAVAKGYGIDCLGKFLEQEGISDFLIELGGELLAKGTHKAKQKSWLVGIEALDSELENRTYSRVVALENEGMATSGNYRKFRTDSLTGKKYVHTIDPITGLAEQSDVTSATVIAPTCGLADAYATAIMAMGFENAVVLLNNLEGVEAYLTFIDENHKAQWFATEGFKQRMLE